MILIAGPYRSGTGDDPATMAANVRADDVARSRGLAVFHALREVPGCDDTDDAAGRIALAFRRLQTSALPCRR
ncbi:MAG TPA: hypothetical protein VL328_18175 [Gemmatimonadaceae bacterium]|jgi:hypothetical protein|nr:hypothetical protein [Gemmatimonadaceae bacterium]